jgi:hypothetical protein
MQAGFIACYAASGQTVFSKQAITTPSTMQAGFIACYAAIGQTVLLKKFIPILRVTDNILKPLTIYYDNQYAVSFRETTSVRCCQIH